MMNCIIWHIKLLSFKLFKNVFVVSCHILISMDLVSQAESVTQGKNVNCQACPILLTQKTNLSWKMSWLGSVWTVLIADGTHSITPEGTQAAHWWVRVKSQDMARRRFRYSFDYEEIKRRICCTVLLKNNSPDFNSVGTCRWLTEYRVTVKKSHNHNSAPCA